jgi:phosphoribosyl 1,2-cyclic phosphodiesterase
VRYGGNTSCVELRTESGALMVFDAGTGLRALGDALMKEDRGRGGHLFIGHTHWDHIQGFPFFTPLFVPGAEWDVYAPRGLEGSLRDVLAGQMEYTYFPVPLERMSATIRFHELVEGQLTVEGATITSQYLNHPALTLGYRVAVDGAVFVYATDHECHAREAATPGAWVEGDVCRDERDARHVALLTDADLVVHDTQYTAEEYRERMGWGHSTIEYAIDVALAARARKLAIYHHDPRRDDEAVDALVLAGRERARSSGKKLEIIAAAEGLTLEVEGRKSERDVALPETPAEVDMRAPALHPALLVCGKGAVERTITDALRAEGIDVASAHDRDGARALAGAGPYSVALVEKTLSAELELPDPAPPVLHLAADGSGPVPSAGAPCDDWLSAPFTAEYARTRIRAALLRTKVRWASAPVPHDETRRLETLRALELLDTSPEEALDRIVRLAARALSVPMAFFNLVDADRVWCKARSIAGPPQLPRDASVCAHTILGAGALVVPDMSADDRFADSPLVREPPNMRFYAGHPIRAPRGEIIGTLCVLDQRPHTMSAADAQTLQDAAELIELELRRR